MSTGKIEKRIQDLERLRASELEAARVLTSMPERKNSFGKFELFEKVSEVKSNLLPERGQS